MIKEEVYTYTKSQLIDWLRYEAGSSNPDYFKSKLKGGLKLQQVPEEYAELLLLLKGFNPKTYLELGIGNGGSFAVGCFFMKGSLKYAKAVDNLAYKNLGIGQSEGEILEFIGQIDVPQVSFSNSTTDNYFETLEPCEKFDVIFIDADHSYEGVKKDYLNALKHINDSGLIIFHDINSTVCPGIKRIWNEVKLKHFTYKEFIHSDTCGIGVIQI